MSFLLLLRGKFFPSLNYYDQSSSLPCTATTKVLPFPCTTTTKALPFPCISTTKEYNIFRKMLITLKLKHKLKKYSEGSFSCCPIFFSLENRFPPQFPFKLKILKNNLIIILVCQVCSLTRQIGLRIKHRVHSSCFPESHSLHNLANFSISFVNTFKLSISFGILFSCPSLLRIMPIVTSLKRVLLD